MADVKGGPKFRIGKCRSCDADVIWTDTAKGNAMPVDAVPVDGGNIDLVEALDPRERPTAHYLNKKGERELTPGGDVYAPLTRYVSHFVTCPNAAQHRKPHAL